MNGPSTADPDGPASGAVHELVRDDVARKRFLKMAGKSIGGAAAASALGTFIAACGSSSSSSSKSPAAASTGSSSTGNGAGGDLAIVNYALTLEYLEAEFYDKVLSSGLFSGSIVSTLKEFRSQEHGHVKALAAVATSLGTPAAKPTGKFPLHSAKQVAQLAATVENLGAAAYLGQAGNIKSKEILAAALAIHTVEARHAAVLNTVTGLTPTPNGAFGSPMSMAEVLKAIKPFVA